MPNKRNSLPMVLTEIVDKRYPFTREDIDLILSTCTKEQKARFHNMQAWHPHWKNFSDAERVYADARMLAIILDLS